MQSRSKILATDLILPYFVVSGQNRKKPIDKMPGVYRLSLDNLIKDVTVAKSLGINAVLLFGIPDSKDASASQSFSKAGIVQKAIKAIKDNVKDVLVFTDVCLCAYTTHGHCGIIRPQATSHKPQAKRKNLKPEACSLQPEIIIDSKATLNTLARIALSHAEAGADYVAPSAMAKKQIKAIRNALDRNGYKKTKIMGYSAKFASNFYGPFRAAAGSAPEFGDRSSYQLESGNYKKALAEIEADIKEGADIVMVKPALSYLDIIVRARLKFNRPLAAYNVSGEYAMVKAYVQRTENRGQRTGIEKKLVFEILTGIKRAGADLIITYHAKDVAKWLIVDDL